MGDHSARCKWYPSLIPFGGVSAWGQRQELCSLAVSLGGLSSMWVAVESSGCCLMSGGCVCYTAEHNVTE